MNHIMRRFLTPLLVMFLAGSLAGCYTLLKHPEAIDDSEETQVLYLDTTPAPIILEPMPILPPPPPHVPPEPPPPTPARPIDPKQPERRTMEVKEEPTRIEILEMESTKAS